MFKDFFSFLKNPSECFPHTYKPKEMLQALALYVAVVFGFLLVVICILAGLRLAFPDLISPVDINRPNAPWYILVLAGPLLEECAFRLPLRRYKAFLAIGLVLFSFIVISSFCFSRRIYTFDHILARLGLAIAAGIVLYLLLHKSLSTCRYGVVFYLSAAFFGLIHAGNYNFANFLPLDFVLLPLYLAKQAVMGITLGYIRLRYGFPVSTGLHILNNLI